MTSSKILSILATELLFSDSLDKAKEEYRNLSKSWHPDMCSDAKATEVFAHINKLYNEAIDKINKGIWEIPGQIKLKDRNAGTEYKIKYHKCHIFELGQMYIGDTIVAYVIDSKYRILFNNAIKQIGSLRYSSDRMRDEISRYMPTIVKSFETDDKLVLVIKKTPDVLCLKDVLDSYYKGDMDPKHIAWIMSRLHNLTCYFQYAKLSHNDISTLTCFISPEFHTCILIGGWFYSVPIGDKMIGANPKTFNLMPPKIKSSKISDKSVDLELIRSVARELMGTHKEPKPMLNWFESASNGDPVKDFQKWQEEILVKCYGERKFHIMDVKLKDIY